MRNTRQRQVILEQLKTHKDHPSADIVYEEVRQILPKISLGTVYRNLELLSDAGLILKLEYGSGQKRFDPQTVPHAHFRCLGCGRLEDFPTNMEIPELSADKKWLSERTVTGASLEYTGYCPNCKSLIN